MNTRLRTVFLVAALQTLALSAPAQQPGAGPSPAAPAEHAEVVLPKLREFVPPELPADAAAPEPGTSVLLDLAVSEQGNVVDAVVVDSAGEPYDTAALDAARRLQFEPALIHGVPSAVRFKYRYELAPPAPAEAAPVPAEFTGRVRDKRSGQPLAGVTITLSTGESAKTDEDGAFDFGRLDPGTRSVTLSGSGFAPIGTEETLESGQHYQATYDLDIPAEPPPPDELSDYEMIVVAPKLEKSGETSSVASDQGTRVAGTGGDAIKVVENLPGVARSTVGSGQLVVWGAGAADTRVYVDGVHIPVLYHEGGYRSVIHSDLVRSVDLQPGGYGAAYGRGLGGLVTVGLRPIEDEGTHGSVGVDAIDAAAAARVQLGEHWRMAVAGRRSHLDWVLGQVTSRDVGDFVPIPRFWDAQARLGWVPNKKESLEVGVLASSDRIRRSLVKADPADNRSESKSTGFERLYVSYRREFDDHSRVRLTPFVGLDRASVVSRFGAVPAELSNRAEIYGFRAAWQGRASDDVDVQVGLDSEFLASSLERSGSVTTPPREGDIRVFGQEPDDQINADRWSTLIGSFAPYVEADAALFDRTLHVVPGLRFEPTLVGGSRITPASGDLPAVGYTDEDTFIEPRLAVRWQVARRVGLRGAVGIYHQPPVDEDLSPVFGNPALGDSRAVHYILGGSLKLSEPLTLEVTSFLARQSELVTRSPLPSPAEAQALVQEGRGRAYGAQLMLRHDLANRLFGWLSYTIMRSERTDPGSSTYRPFDFDQTHVLTALASYDLGAGFEVGARARYASGYPRTPVVRAAYDARIDKFQPVFGEHNSIRIPSFWQLDARVAKRFKLGAAGEAEAYLDVQNVTNRKNPEEIIYDDDYTRRSYITGLPVLPVLGGKYTW
jgi:TonB family protein